MASTIFPISIIARQWLIIDEKRKLCVAHDEGTWRSIGIGPNFGHAKAPITSTQDLADLEEKQSRKFALHMLEQDEHDYIALDKQMQSYKDHRQRLKLAQLKLAEINKRIEQKASKKEHELCAFASSAGLIALPISFEEAANMVAMAQRGHIVEFSMDMSNYQATITARKPTLRNRKKTAPIPGLRPANQLKR